MEAHAFDRLVRSHKDSVYRQMVRVCGQREDAEDALATALMLAFRASAKLKSEDAFRGWLATIGTRVCMKMRSNAKIELAYEFAEERGLLATDARTLEMRVMKSCVADALGSLSSSARQIYEMCEIEQRTIKEAAEIAGVSLAAAKTRLLRARAKMRTLLDESLCS